MAINTLDTINNVLHQVFAVAVDDEYLRSNPTDGVYASIKAAFHYETPKRHAADDSAGTWRSWISSKIRRNTATGCPSFTFLLGTGMPHLGSGRLVLVGR